MDRPQQHLRLLGMSAVDRVTGFRGVITTITFDLFGCIQALIHAGLDKEGKPMEQVWFDVNRLEIASSSPVMKQPDFVNGPIAEGDKGPAEKPVGRWS